MRSALTVLGFTMLLMSCAIGASWPHENFLSTYRYYVGKSVDDPTISIAPQNTVGRRTLPNGNIEIEYLHVKNAYGRYGHCRVFFEVNPDTEIIVDWRYEGSEKACVIPP